MNPPKILRFAFLGVVLLCAAATSTAMTLGRARGAVLVGQPLKLSVPIQLESGEGPSDLCFEAEVFYGDTRQDASRVTVSSDHLPQTQLANVHVTSYANVDEPVVTVYLRSGCEHKSTRRFVLLADLASEVLPSESRLVGVPQPVLPVVVSQRQSTSADRTADSTVAKRRRPTGSETAPTSVVPVLPATRASPIRRPHLKLLPVDLTEEHDPALKLSSELYFGESENLQKRSEAAALWKSLNATPQDILSAESRRRSMEEDLKGLQVVTAKNRQTLEELAGRLESAESQRYANPLVYGLVGILLLCSLGLAYLLFKMRQGGRTTPQWWGAEEFSGKSDSSRSDKDEDGVPAPNNRGEANAAHVVAEELSNPVAGKAAATLTEVDIDLQLDEPSFLNERKASDDGGAMRQAPSLDSSSRAIGHTDFAQSMTATLRAVNTKEMLDVRQQADFFMTLGQHEEALGLLKDCVDGSAEANPLVYLDLLRILHTLGRKTEFDHYRSDFNMLFSGHVPGYTAFNQGGDGLEAYPDICQSIVAFWPSEQAIDYIEKCLVREIGDGEIQGMDLEAFRDLLMLHGIAKRIASSSESGLLPFSTSRASPVEQGAVYSADVDDFDLRKDAQPVSVNGVDIANQPVDFDLTQAPGNLIDFDASDFSQQDQGVVGKP